MENGEIIEKLQNFVFYLAHKAESPETIGMEFEDICGELNEEIVKGIAYYNKKNLNEGQMLAVLRSMCDNRVSELRYKYFKTHRAAAKNNVSLEVTVEVKLSLGGDSQDDDEGLNMPMAEFGNPEALISSSYRVEETRRRLSEKSRKVFDAVIAEESPFLFTIMLAATMRSGKEAKVRPHMLSDALGITEKEAIKAFYEIKRKYSEVVDEE